MTSAPRIAVGFSALLAVLALWLAFDNPTVGAWSRGDDYQCLAPWDTVLNGASNVPGGDREIDSDEVGVRCREAGRQRFALAGVGALASAAGGLLAVARKRSAAQR